MRAILSICISISVFFTPSYGFADDWGKEWPSGRTVNDKPLNLPVNNSLYLPAGDIVQIEEYDARTQIYLVKLTKNHKVTTWHIKRQSLADAIAALDQKILKRKPNSIVGSVYKIDKEVQVIETLEGRRPSRMPLRLPASQ